MVVLIAHYINVIPGKDTLLYLTMHEQLSYLRQTEI